MPPTTTCPEPDALSRLLLGQLSDQDSEVVTAHLEQCQGCLEAVREIGARDPLVSAVRGWAEGCPATVSQVEGQETQVAPPAMTPGLDPLAERLIEQLRRLPLEPNAKACADAGGGHESQAPAFPFLHAPQQPDELGRLGKYRILKVLGQGGMGVVFQAHDPRLKRLCAIKAMRPEVASREGMKERFLREAQAAAALESDYVVPIYQVDEDNGAPYIAMPFLKGMSLEDWLQTRQREKPDSKLKPQVILKLARDIARGLQEAHASGLIHRDIKPANIWLDSKVSGRARILDFGLARLTEGTGDQHLTQSGMVLGTPSYMAPEQAEGEKLDGRADLFSLGVILYRLCTGELPFKGNSTLATLAALATRDPPPPAAVNPATPPALSDLVMRLLCKDREGRIGSAKEVLREIQRIERELPPETTRGSQAASESVSVTDAASVASSPAVDAAIVGELRGDDVARAENIDDASSSASTMLQAAGNIAASQIRRLHRLPPRYRRWTAIAAAATAIVLAGIVLYWATDKGTVRIEINAPGITAQIDENGATLTQADKQPIRLSSGQHGLRIKYGELEFETNKFILPRGETVDLKVELLPGKVQVVQGDKSIGEHPLPTAVVNVAVKGWHGWPLDAPPPAIAPFDAAQAKAHQEAWAKYLDVPVEYTNSIGMKFRLIPPGEFLMGSTPEEIEAAQATVPKIAPQWEQYQTEGPRHAVVLTRPIYLGIHEVTQSQYERIMGKNPSHHAAGGPNPAGRDIVTGLDTSAFPVELVSWNDAAAFCVKLSAQENLLPRYFHDGNIATIVSGDGYRLPTEAEWEFAGRGGTTTKYWNGDVDADLGTASWHMFNSGRRPHAVGELAPNPFGLYDIHGNVAERVQDWWGRDYYEQFADAPAIDPENKSSEGSELKPHAGMPVNAPLTVQRAVRGGNFQSRPMDCRTAYREANGPGGRTLQFGFRVALSVDAIRQADGGTPAEVDDGADFALSFGRVNGVRIPSLRLDRSGPWTIELRTKPRVVLRPDGAFGFLAAVNNQAGLFLQPGGNWAVHTRQGTADNHVGDEAVAEREVHLAGVRDGNELRLYLDGKLTARQVVGAVPLNESADPFVIGGDYYGEIDEIRISRTARYTQDYEPVDRFTADADTVALYHCDEGQGNSLPDTSGNGHDGVIQGATWIRRSASTLAPAMTAYRETDEYRQLMPGTWHTLPPESFTPEVAAAWTLEGGDWTFNGSPVWSPCAAPAAVGTDMAFRARIEPLDARGCEGALVLRAGPDELYQGINFAAGTFWGGRRRHGIYQQLGILGAPEWAGWAATPQAPIELTAYVEGGRLVMFANGERVSEMHDPHPAAHGSVGMQFLTSARFRDMQVQYLNETPAVISPPPVVIGDAEVVLTGPPRAFVAQDIGGTVDVSPTSGMTPARLTVKCREGAGTRYSFTVLFSDDKQNAPKQTAPVAGWVTDTRWMVAYSALADHQGDAPPADLPANAMPDDREQVRELSWTWGDTPPTENIPAGPFLLTADLTAALPSGWYRLRATAGRSVRARLDGRIVLDNWTDPSIGRSVAYVQVSEEGSHDWQIESFQPATDRSLSVVLEPLPADFIPPTSTDPAALADRWAAEWALRAGGSIKITIDGQERALTAKEVLPAGEFTLNEVSITGGDVSPADLALHDTRMTSLLLRQLPVGEAIMARVGRLERLTFFSLFETGTTNDALRHLAGLKNLEWLWVQRVAVDDAGLAHLLGLIKVKRLYLSDLNLTDEGLKSLGKLPALEELRLGGCGQVTGTFATGFRGSTLRSIWLNSPFVKATTEGLAAIAALPQIETLDMGDRSRVTSESLAALKGQPTLKQLVLAGTNIGDDAVPHLASIPNLAELNITGTKISQDGFARLKVALPNCKIAWKRAADQPVNIKSAWRGWPADAPPPAIAPFDAEQAKAHQEAWAEYLGIPVEYTNSIGMKFRLIPPGEFMMGSTPEEIGAALAEEDPKYHQHIPGEGPRHKVILTQPMYLGIHEVTQRDYELVVGTNPSHFTAVGAGKDAVVNLDTLTHPVEQVSWNDAMEFCAKLSEREQLHAVNLESVAGETATTPGTVYRLPTEAEWEFACRAGTTTKFWSGDRDESLLQVGWRGRNAGGRTHAAGELKSNPLGLFDMHGNVWEWVQDRWESGYYGQFAEEPAIDPSGPPPSNSGRVIRGGYWHANSSNCRSANRSTRDPAFRSSNLGFRVALSVDDTRKPLAAGVDKPASAPEERQLLAFETPGFDQWVKEVTALPADQQVDAVAKKLQYLNPEFDGKVTKRIENGVVVDLDFLTEKVTDLSPVRALVGLRTLFQGARFGPPSNLSDLSPLRGLPLTSLNCSNSKVHDLEPLKGMKLKLLECLGTQVFDLSPLRGMPLDGLNCNASNVSDLTPLAGMRLKSLSVSNTKVSDLSPLAGMPLTGLSIGHSQVSDLSALKGMPLEVLYCDFNQVADLSPLKGMKLTYLKCINTLVTDYSPLEEMPLKNLDCDIIPARDTESLRAIKSLETINGKPVAEFWKDVPEKSDRAAAEWALSGGATIGIQVGDALQTIAPTQPLPAGEFQLREIRRPTTVQWAKEDLAVLAELKSLRILDLFQCNPISAEAWRQIGQCASLEELHLQRTNISDEMLGHIQNLRGLKTLVLQDTYVTDKGLDRLAALSNLEVLGLGGCPQVTGTFAAAFRESPLRELSLGPAWGMTADGLRAIVALPRLESLNASGASIVVDDQFVGQKSLLRLNLHGSGVGDEAAPALRSMSQLQELELSDTWVTAKGFADLRAALPGCRITGEPRGTVDAPEYASLATGRWQRVAWTEQDLENWRMIAPAKQSVEVVDGTVRLSCDNLTQSLLLPVPSVTARNLLVRARVRKPKDPGLSAGIRARRDENGDMTAWFNTLSARNFGIGEHTTPGGWRDLTIGLNTRPSSDWFEWTFAAIDDRFSTYAEGRLVCELVDSKIISAGEVAFETYGALELRDVEVMVLDEPK